MDLISTHNGVFTEYLQPVFDERAEEVKPFVEWYFHSPRDSFITALLPMLKNKINTFLPQVANYPQLLSHFMHQLMIFDNEIRETWNYVPYLRPRDEWKGLSWEVLAKEAWFDRWLQVRRILHWHDTKKLSTRRKVDSSNMTALRSQPPSQRKPQSVSMTSLRLSPNGTNHCRHLAKNYGS